MVAVTFLVGTVHAFGSARAAVSTPPPATMSGQIDKNVDLTTSLPPAHAASADTTTGIIDLSLVIVVIILVGAFLGRSKLHI